MVYRNFYSHEDVNKDLSRWLTAVTAMAIAGEAIHFILTGQVSFISFIPSVDWKDCAYFIGSFFGIPAGVLWIGNKLPPAKIEWSWMSLLLGILLYLGVFCLDSYDALSNPISVFCIICFPLGVLWTFYGLKGAIVCRDKKWRDWLSLYLKVSTFLAMLSVATHAGLADNRILLPITWDYHVYRIDGAFWGIASRVASLNDATSPFIETFSLISYSILVLAIYAVTGLAIRTQNVAEIKLWRFIVLLYAIAFLLYAVVPVCGPAYAFFDGSFPDHLPNPLNVIASPVVVPPAFRNGMPSMHLTGALMLVSVCACIRHRVGIVLTVALSLATVWSTLARGEHYVLDLVVALPYAAFMSAYLIKPRLLRVAKTAQSLPFYICGITFVSWLVLLRSAPIWLSDHQNIVRLLSLWSMGCWAWSYAVLFRSARSEDLASAHSKEQVARSSLQQTISAPRWVIAIFVASGISGLIYEVVYAKALAVTFGSTAQASYTVLATYMGGMAIGSWLGSMVADRISSPLFGYAITEACIGTYAAITPLLFGLIQSVYVALSLDVPPDSGWLTLLRVVLGIVCLGIPTVLMGATVPLMFKHLRDTGLSGKRAVGVLYAANTLGAGVGSVIAGYFILPALGRNGGTCLAAAMSLLIALYVLQKDKLLPRRTEGPKRTNKPRMERSSEERGVAIAALCVLGVGGAVTLGLEVNCIHLLAVVAGNSVYAFALMLSAFLFGLGAGALAGEFLIGRFRRVDVLSCAQCGIAFSLALTAHTWDGIPDYFSSFSIYGVTLSFGARELIRALVCLVAMLPPAFFIGMSYPASASTVSDWLSPQGGARGLGVANAVNTMGNICGVFIVGFWMLPAMGSHSTILILALVSLGLGGGVLLVASLLKRVKHRWVTAETLKIVFPFVTAAVALLFFPAAWNQDSLSSGSNVYFTPQSWGKVIDHAESIEGGITSVAKQPNGVLTLLTNGKFQGNNAEGGEMVAQESFAMFPLLHTAQRGKALVIGYGTGMTAKVLDDAGFKAIDIAELSKDVVTLANRYFEPTNHRISQKPTVTTRFTDGRNYLLTQSKQFDLISIEITSIWFAGAANCYNREFYALAKKRLTQQGVLQQWIQLHHISPVDIAYVVGSMRSEFRYVWLYVRGGQGVLVASDNEAASRLPGAELVRVGGHDTRELGSHLVLSPSGVDRFVGSIDPTKKLLVSTDVNLYLEHSTPKGNALSADTWKQNVSLLSRFEAGL